MKLTAVLVLPLWCANWPPCHRLQVPRSARSSDLNPRAALRATVDASSLLAAAGGAEGTAADHSAGGDHRTVTRTITIGSGGAGPAAAATAAPVLVDVVVAHLSYDAGEQCRQAKHLRAYLDWSVNASASAGADGCADSAASFRPQVLKIVV